MSQKIKTRKDAFSAKYGSEAIFSLYPYEVELMELQNALLSQWFFTSKTFVIIYSVAWSNKNKSQTSKTNKVEERLIDHRDQIPETTTLILAAKKPDKRLKSYKFFKNECTVYEFKSLDGRSWPWFLRGLLPMLTTPQAKLILSLVWNDAQTLVWECDKLQHYLNAHSREVLSDEDIRAVVYNHNLSDNFELLDKLIVDPDACIGILDEARRADADVYQYMWMLYRWFKIILGMTELYESGITDAKIIASTLKIHPFAISKQIKKIKTFVDKKDDINSMYTNLLQLDYQTKTWRADGKQIWLYIKSIVS